MSIDIENVKRLRAATKAAMQDCIKALTEASGDYDAAEALIKEWGKAGAETRADRVAREGGIFAASSDAGAVLVELLCETDFVAKAEDFVATGRALANRLLALSSSDPDSEAKDLVAGAASIFKEKLEIGRTLYRPKRPGELIETYVHGNGRIGSFVVLLDEAGGDARIGAFAHDLALHVAAFAPVILDDRAPPEDHKTAILDDIKTELAEEPATMAKPPAILEGIIAGKLRKRLADSSLLGRGFVRDEKRSVARALAELCAETGGSTEPVDFGRLELGEDR